MHFRRVNALIEHETTEKALEKAKPIKRQAVSSSIFMLLDSVASIVKRPMLSTGSTSKMAVVQTGKGRWLVVTVLFMLKSLLDLCLCLELLLTIPLRGVDSVFVPSTVFFPL